MMELRDQRAELDREVNAELEPLEERAERVLDAGHLRRERMLEEIELPEVVAKEVPGAAEGWLFDSRRGYFEQLQRYKSHKASHGHNDRLGA